MTSLCRHLSVVSTGNCKLGHDCRRVCSHRRRDATRQFRLVGVGGVYWAYVVVAVRITTRNLCYRKDDRTMPLIHGCPEKFRDSLTTPTDTIPNIFRGHLFRSTLWMFLQNLKSVALPVPEIIGVPKKFGQSLDAPTLRFLHNFQWSFIRIGPVNVPAKFEVRSFYLFLR